MQSQTMEPNIISSPFGNVNLPNVSLPEFLRLKFYGHDKLSALIDVENDKVVRFSDLIESGEFFARAFVKLGLKHGDVVAVCSPNSEEYLLAMIGVLSLGGIWAPFNPESTEEEIHHHFSLSIPRFIFTHETCLNKVNRVRKAHGSVEIVVKYGSSRPNRDDIEELIRDFYLEDSFNPTYPDPSDVAFYLSSSGTTGLPKLVQLTHSNVVANLVQMLHKDNPRHEPYRSFHPTVGKPYIHVYPFFHSGGLIFSTLWPLCEGAHLVLLRNYEPNKLLEAIGKYKPHLFIGPPPVLVFLTKSDAGQNTDLASIRTVISGAMPVSQELKLKVCDRLKIPYIFEGYGLTEASPETHLMPCGKICENKPGSCGVLIPGTEAKILNLDNKEALGYSCMGQLIIRGPQVMKGYLKNTAATRDSIDREGWLYTGDLAYYDKDEFFYVVDRVKDLMNIGGHLVAPAELEHIIMSHPGVADVGVVGKKSTGLCEDIPVAFVVLKSDLESVTAKEIEDFVTERVASYKIIVGGVRFVTNIPRAASGKILRRRLMSDLMQ